MEETSTLVRDVFNPKSIGGLAKGIQQAHGDFNADAFTKEIVDQLGELSYSERIELITGTLEAYLPSDPAISIDILIRALPPEMPSSGEASFRGFIIVTLTRYVSRNGLEHFDLSMRALYEMTKRFTAEWDIRPFIVKYPEQTLKLLKDWLTDPNMHVRRLVSEGTRTRLPWGMRLKMFIDDPYPVLDLLEYLKDDPELYVRRSVANNLNDIAKDHPELVVETLTRWQQNASEGTQWVIKHATRTLIKDGHNEALALLGFDPNVKAELRDLKLNTDLIHMGDTLEFSATLSLQEKAAKDLVVDYVIYFMKANGKLAPKVFKLKTLKAKPGEPIQLSKRHAIKPITTRKYYAGKHELGILVNGREMARTLFQLKL